VLAAAGELTVTDSMCSLLLLLCSAQWLLLLTAAAS